MTKKLKKTACFICAFTVLTVSLLWLAWGIKENTKYHRITAQITDISEFSTENSNFYKSGGKEKYTAANANYKYKDLYGKYHTDEFTVYEFESDKYAVGDNYYIYQVDGWRDPIAESLAKSDMLDNLVWPVIFTISALIVTLLNAKGLKYFGIAADRFQFQFILTIVIYVLCAGYTAYILFFWRTTAIYFSGLDELFHMAGAILMCTVGVIVDAVVWGVSISRLPASEGEI